MIAVQDYPQDLGYAMQWEIGDMMQGGGHAPTHRKLKMESVPADDGVDRRWAEPDGREAVLLCGYRWGQNKQLRWPLGGSPVVDARRARDGMMGRAR